MNTRQTKRQSELAACLGVTKEHLNAVLCRRVRPSVDLAKKIEANTGTPWQSFFEDAPPEAAPQHITPHQEAPTGT